MTSGGLETSKKIQIDDRLESYHTFFDHAWAKDILSLTKHQALDTAIVDLCASWRGVANTHVMPWIMAHNMAGFADGFFQDYEPFGVKLVAAIREKLINAMGSSLRNMQRQKLTDVLNELNAQVLAVNQQSKQTYKFPVDRYWEQMLQLSEFRFSIWGSQRLCFSGLYHAYEHFLVSCVRIVKNDPQFRIPRRPEFGRVLQDLFGEDIKRWCWDERQVAVARELRHSLAHANGRVTKELQNVANKLPVSDGEIQILPNMTSKLFHILKRRAMRMARTADSKLTSSLMHL